jgi:hypothetical protein
MPDRGKHEKPKSGFPPFPPSLETRKGSGLSTFPQLRRLFLLIQTKIRAWLSGKTETNRVGQNKLPKWAKISCQTQSPLMKDR